MLTIIIAVSLVTKLVYDQAIAKASKRTENDGALTVLMQVIAGFTVLLCTPLDTIRFVTDWKIWIALTIACVFYAINDRIITPIRRELPVLHVSVLNEMTSVFLVLIGLLFFREPFSLYKITAMAMIIGGNIMILYERPTGDQLGNTERRRRRRTIGFGILARIAMSIALSIDIDISTNYNLAHYVALSLIIPSLLILIFDRSIKLRDFKVLVLEGGWKTIVIAGVALGFQTYTMLKAYQLGDILTVAPLLALSILANALYEWVVKKETKKWKIKLAVSVMMVIATYLVSLG